MTYKTFNNEFFDFINESPTSFHCAHTISKILEKEGFTQLNENEFWALKPNTNYFTCRNNGALIAFNPGDSLNKEIPDGLHIIGCHTDSPSLKIKPNPDIQENTFHSLGIEVYGGPILSTWFDRNLALAGRVNWLDANSTLQSSLFKSKTPCLYIPNLAIHLDRNKNKGTELNPQKHLSPIFGQYSKKDKSSFNDWLLAQLSNDQAKSINKILNYDVFCYDPTPPAYTGVSDEFFSCSRLDNLASCFIGLKAMVDNKTSKQPSFFICNDHEEIGSTSLSGAGGSFADDILQRIYPELQTRQVVKNKSFFISMDNAHAIHPNYSESSDSNHKVKLNGGVVIKNNANHRYATDSITSSIFTLLCDEVKVPVQEFVMRSDMPCGSTIGPITSATLGVKTIDVGIPTLGMHSIRELTGSKDVFSLFEVIRLFLTKELK